MIKCLHKNQLREERPGFSWRSQVTGHHCRKSRQDPEAATQAQSQSKETPMHTCPLLLSSPPPKPREQPPMSIYPSAYLVVGVYCSFAALFRIKPRRHLDLCTSSRQPEQSPLRYLSRSCPASRAVLSSRPCSLVPTAGEAARTSRA